MAREVNTQTRGVRDEDRDAARCLNYRRIKQTVLCQDF